MFLLPPADSPATASLFQSDLDERGYVMNLSRVWAWRPEVQSGFAALRTLLTGESALSKRELGVLVCATASSLGDSYCSLAWGKLLADAADPASAAAVLQGVAGPGLTARDQALSVWACKVVADPNATTRDDVDALRAAGFTEREIFEATAFIGFRLAFSTINAALGARPDWQVAAAAPPEVQQAVAYGRPVAERASSA
jgi:uncharacterized peroxidase-related enzyme